jgi:hypothetical protein
VVGVERIAASDRCYPIGADRRSRPGLSKPASGPPARTPGYVRAWAEKYQDRGLVVVGVHTPEFPFEQDADNVRWAANDMHVEYPIALDQTTRCGEAFANRYWPAVYIADGEGRIRHHHFGEGGYEQCEQVVQQLLRDAGRDGRRRARLDRPRRPRGAGRLVEPAVTGDLLGYRRAQNFATPDDAEFDQAQTYAVPERLSLNQWARS